MSQPLQHSSVQAMRMYEQTPINEVSTPELELLVAREEIELLREQVESLYQLTQNLYSELDDKQQQIQELEQELHYTNRELRDALTSRRREINEAKQLAVKILQRKKSTSKSVTQMLTAIYGCEFSVAELETGEPTGKIEFPSSALIEQTINRSRELRTLSQQTNAQYQELGFQFVSFKASFAAFQERVAKMATELEQKTECEENTPEY